MNRQPISHDDFSATAGDYFFRVEQMDKNYWWWAVYFKEEEIAGSLFSSEVARTKEQAFKLAEKAYKKHLKLK